MLPAEVRTRVAVVRYVLENVKSEVRSSFEVAGILDNVVSVLVKTALLSV